MSFTRVCQVTDLAPEEALGVVVDGVKVAVARDSAGQWHAIGDVCTHGEVLLSEGDVEDNCIECWGHAARFNLTTGEATLPATQPAAVYALRIDGDDVLVDVEERL